MSDDEYNGWDRSIFGTNDLDLLDEVQDVIDALDAEGQRHGGLPPGNPVPAVTQATIHDAFNLARRRKLEREERAALLLVDRFIEEWPEAREVLAARFKSRLLAAIDPLGLRNTTAVAETLGVFDEPRPDAEPHNDSIRRALLARVAHGAVDLLAEAFRRAYQKQIDRNAAMRRLGGADDIPEWSWKRATEIVQGFAARIKKARTT